MVVRKHNGLRMKIKQARTERADHKVVAFKCLVRWRRHVMLAHNRTEVINVERVWVIATIPTNHIAWMMLVVVAMHLVAALNANFKLAGLIKVQRLLWKAQVALAVGRVFQKLRGGF